MSVKPILALTMGDPVGVGPEIMVLALADPLFIRSAAPWCWGIFRLWSGLAGNWRQG